MTPPDDNARSIFTNPYISGVVGAAIAAAASYLASFVNRKPALQEAINAGFAELAEKYRSEFADMTSTIAALKAELEELNLHVLDLTAVLEKHGITPPPRQRKTKTAN